MTFVLLNYIFCDSFLKMLYSWSDFLAPIEVPDARRKIWILLISEESDWFSSCRVWQCSARRSRSVGITRPRLVCLRDVLKNALSQCNATPTSSPSTISSLSSPWLATWTSPLKNPAYDAVLSASRIAVCERRVKEKSGLKFNCSVQKLKELMTQGDKTHGHLCLHQNVFYA